MKITSSLKRVLFVSFALVLLGCKTSPTTGSLNRMDATGSFDVKRSNLSQKEAEARAAVVRNVAYELSLDLDAASDTFRGTLEAKFDLASVPETLFLDFRAGAKVTTFTVNGETLAPEARDGRLFLPVAKLRAGANAVAVGYSQLYSKDGSGLYRFEDPLDRAVYLYTQFETFDANHMFPCFDQPDLRATLAMKVAAPAEWTVLSTSPEKLAASADGRKTWTFERTPSLSTYVFSLMAGPYASWSSSAGKIPLRLFARQSLKSYVVPEEWFSTTRRGFEFFNAYFAYDYPFKKYDQIIVPDFNAGAMENVAAVTFSERYVPRGAKTQRQKDGLADTILHEMAHMWFGDLVTMKWWDGLWLNESFATYMAALAYADAAGGPDSWRTFSAEDKSWAMWEDRLVTNHPIDGEIADTRSAFTNFDGITYGKGASVLKQLSLFLGPEKFRDGVRLYFKKHAYGNTVRADFIGALEFSSKRDLKEWSRLWLERKGMDTVHAEAKCEAGKVKSLTVTLRPPEGDTELRPHATIIGLYGGKDLRLQKQARVLLERRETVVTELAGAPCPRAIAPNIGDHDFVKVQLDAVTLATVREDILSLQDPHTRMMIWRDLFQMVEDAELPAFELVSMMIESLAREKDPKILSQLLRPIPDVVRALPVATKEDRATVDVVGAKIEHALRARARRAKPGSEDQKLSADGLVKYTRTKAGASFLVDWLRGKETIPGFALDQDRRWAIIIRASSLGHGHAPALIAAESKADPSERGQQFALTATASKPDAATKTELLERSLKDESMTLARVNAIFDEILPPWQDEHRAAFADRFYRELPGLLKTRESDYLDAYMELAPAWCEDASVDRLGSYLKESGPTLPPEVLKSLRIANQEDARCVSARALKR